MVLQLLIAWLAARINRHQDHVITYLREESRILKAKLKDRRIQLTDTERRRLAVLAHHIDRKHLKDVSTIVTPDTLQRWYRRLVGQTPSRKPLGQSLWLPRIHAGVPDVSKGLCPIWVIVLIRQRCAIFCVATIVTRHPFGEKPA